MKKFLLLVLLSTLFSFVVSADAIQLGTFPVGKWVDNNFNAVWEFTTTNIRILDLNGKVYYDFAGKTITGFKVELKAGKPSMTFSCTETGKTYIFTKPLDNMDIIMDIDRQGKTRYTVTLKQK